MHKLGFLLSLSLNAFSSFASKIYVLNCVFTWFIVSQILAFLYSFCVYIVYVRMVLFDKPEPSLFTARGKCKIKEDRSIKVNLWFMWTFCKKYFSRGI